MEYFDEIIVFLVVFFLLFFPLVKRILVARHKKKQAPPQTKIGVASQEKEFRPFVEQITPKPKKPGAPPVPLRTVGKNFKFQSELEALKRKTAVESRHIGTRVKPKFKETVVSEALSPRAGLKRKKRLSSMDKLLMAPPSFKKMVIMHEIFRRPKSLQ